MDGCIAVHSNDFLYNAKANWNSKNHFCLKKQRGDFLGRFELFSWNFNIASCVCILDSIAVSLFTNSETAAATPLRVMRNFQRTLNL